MKILMRVAVLLYVALVIVTGGGILFFALQWIQWADFQSTAHLFYTDENLRTFAGFWAVLLLVQNLVFYRLIFKSIDHANVIAFDNPSGRVSVSLAALEDLIRRKISQIDDVRDVKPHITTSKKGLNVKVRLILRSEVSIPELTSDIQDQVKKRLQEMIGLEEPLEVSIYVGKIIPEKGKPSQKKKEEVNPDKSDANIPFQGYRA